MPAETNTTKVRPSIDGSSMPLFHPFQWDPSKWFMIVPHCQANFARALLQHRQEALAFAEQRCAEDLKLADRLCETQDVNETFSAWSEFLSDASAQYASHIGKLAELTSTGALDAVRKVQQETEAVTHIPDLPKAA